MKIKLRSNGQIIDPPLRVAQRYIRLGRASVYVEPVIEKPKSAKKAKKKKEEVIESQTTERQELSPGEVQGWTGSGDTE